MNIEDVPHLLAVFTAFLHITQCYSIRSIDQLNHLFFDLIRGEDMVYSSNIEELKIDRVE